MLFWRLWILLWGAPLAVSAQPGLTAPRIGLMRDGGSSVAQLDGVEGSFTVGDELARGVRALAWSGERGVAVDAERLMLLGPLGQVLRSEPAPNLPEGAIATGFWDSTPIAWIPGEARLVALRDSATIRIALKLRAGEQVLSICGRGATLWAAVSRGDRVQVIAFDPATGDAVSVETTSIDSKNVLLPLTHNFPLGLVECARLHGLPSFHRARKGSSDEFQVRDFLRILDRESDVDGVSGRLLTLFECGRPLFPSHRTLELKVEQTIRKKGRLRCLFPLSDRKCEPCNKRHIANHYESRRAGFERGSVLNWNSGQEDRKMSTLARNSMFRYFPTVRLYNPFHYA